MKEEADFMDCVEFKEIYHDLDRPGTPGYRFRERALTHAESCACCGLLLTDGEALDFALGNLSQHNAGREAPPRVEAALLREFRVAKLAGSRRRVREQLAALSVAAAILLAMGLGVQHRIASRSSTAVQSAKLAPDSSAAAVDNTAATNEQVEDEYASGFVPVPYADDPAALEGGAIVRVTLPRSALPSFGLPITESEGSDSVFADLVVSEDGTPQAIRLVSDADPNLNF
jgi:hypothetical protein